MQKLSNFSDGDVTQCVSLLCWALYVLFFFKTTTSRKSILRRLKKSGGRMKPCSLRLSGLSKVDTVSTKRPIRAVRFLPEDGSQPVLRIAVGLIERTRRRRGNSSRWFVRRQPRCFWGKQTPICNFY